jgi:hypothetical protein
MPLHHYREEHGLDNIALTEVLNGACPLQDDPGEEQQPTEVKHGR